MHIFGEMSNRVKMLAAADFNYLSSILWIHVLKEEKLTPKIVL